MLLRHFILLTGLCIYPMAQADSYAGLFAQYTTLTQDDSVWSYGLQLGERNLWQGLGAQVSSSINVPHSLFSLDLKAVYALPKLWNVKSHVGLGGGLDYLFQSVPPANGRSTGFVSGLLSLEIPFLRLNGIDLFLEGVPRWFPSDSSYEVEIKTGLHFTL
ncbi:MAG: hypothetical protein U0Z75_06775 [Deinococcaceae bacterium]